MKKLSGLSAIKLTRHLNEPEGRTRISMIALNAFYWGTIALHISAGRLGNFINDIWGGAQDAGFSPHELLEEMCAAGGTLLISIPIRNRKQKKIAEQLDYFQ